MNNNFKLEMGKGGGCLSGELGDHIKNERWREGNVKLDGGRENGDRERETQLSGKC